MRLLLSIGLCCLLSGGAMAQRGGGGGSHGGGAGGGFHGGGGLAGGTHGGASHGGGFVGGGSRGGRIAGGYRGGYLSPYLYGCPIFGGYLDSGFDSYSPYTGAYSDTTSDSYPAPVYSYNPSPNVTVVYAPPPAPEPVPAPVITNVPNPPNPTYDEYGQPSNAVAASDAAPIYLLAMKDHTIYAAAAYWVDGKTLHYVTLQHEEKQVPLDRVDRRFSQQLNRERRVAFHLPVE